MPGPTLRQEASATRRRNPGLTNSPQTGTKLRGIASRMGLSATRNFRLFALAGVLAAPAAVVLAIILALVLGREQDRQRLQSVVTSRTVMAEIDARARADAAALRVLASHESIVAGDWRAARTRAITVLRDSPGWRAVVLTDRGGQPLFDTLEPSARPSFALRADEPLRSSRGGVYARGPGCPCVAVHQAVPSAPGATLTVLVDARVFQALLLQHIDEAGGVTAVVDGSGRFIARSRDYARRAGAFGSSALRGAVTRGGAGTYSGKTLEGQPSHTAFVTSADGGWSTHVAQPRAYQDNPGRLLTLVVVAGALSALLTAGALAWRAWTFEQRERRNADELVRLQKIEAVGRFTSSVAHDFNNLLTVVIGGLAPLAEGKAGPEAARRARPALQAAEAGAKLCGQLLSFARHDVADTRAISLSEVWSEVSTLIEQSVGKGVVVRFSDAPGAPRVRANPDQIKLALINLAVNARDAMDGRGMLDVRVDHSGAEVTLRVTDTGPGVSPAARSRIFDPFFTTKAPGKGTGLGLAQVVGAVRQADGRIDLEDAPSGGASFVMRFPTASMRG